MSKEDNPVPSLDKDEINLIEVALLHLPNRSEKIFTIINKLKFLQNGVETNNEQPLEILQDFNPCHKNE